MKKFVVRFSALAVVLSLLTGCSTMNHDRAAQATTGFTLFGPAGKGFTGFYVQNGERVAVTGVMPWIFHGTGVTSFEFLKNNPMDNVIYEVFCQNNDSHSFHSGPLGPGTLGVRGEIHHRNVSTRPVFPSAEYRLAGNVGRLNQPE